MLDDLIAWLRTQLDIDEEITQDVVVTGDPARWIAEIETKRRILDEVVPAIHGYANFDATYLVQMLGLPYAHRDGYLPEWHPDSDVFMPPRV